MNQKIKDFGDQAHLKLQAEMDAQPDGPRRDLAIDLTNALGGFLDKVPDLGARRGLEVSESLTVVTECLRRLAVHAGELANVVREVESEQKLSEAMPGEGAISNPEDSAVGDGPDDPAQPVQG